MNGHHILILTDHVAHSAENSLYALASAIYVQPDCLLLDIASRSTPANQAFFSGEVESDLAVVQIREDLDFHDMQRRFMEASPGSAVQDYDFIILRLPPPLSRTFTEALTLVFDERCIINRPSGIFATGSKEFLLRFPELCPPIAMIRSREDLLAFSARFAVVLKPPRSYSGKGIVRIEEGVAELDDHHMPIDTFIINWDASEPYLGMQFLKNVDQGDKRVVVCNGEILGASLRLPRPGGWKCNVAQGGSSQIAEVTKEEEKIARTLFQPLYDRGVVLFGFDTLVDDDGRRVLSEINTTSIGGIKQMEIQQRRPIVQRAARLLMDYIHQTIETI